MNISLFLSVCFVLIFNETIAKSGGGGRGGGGRGHSGARSSSRSFSRSGGGKFHSGTSHSSYVHYDSSSFRSSVFSKSSSNSYFSTGPTGNTYVISQPATPIIYDNHYYYWHGYYRSSPEKKTVCEYTISDEDGELTNVTFANGTSPKTLTFGCGGWEKCCGMTCCSVVGDWMALTIWFFIILFVICYSCCRTN